MNTNIRDEILEEVDSTNGVYTTQTDNELEELRKLCRITLDDNLIPPQPVISQVLPNEQRTIFSRGDISLIMGKAKSRKSFLVNMFLRAALSTNEVNGMIGSLPNEQNRILYVDTEQRGFFTQQALVRLKKEGVNQDVLETQSLRVLSAQKRLQLTEHIIQTTPNLGFVVIDGIRDLVTSINDEEQASMICHKLMKWSAEHNIHIVTILHQNKGDGHARGHLGTELVNKSETVLSVTKSDLNPDISIVKSECSRGIDIQDFAFEIVENIPTVIQGYELQAIVKTKKDLLSLADHTQQELLDEVFDEGQTFMYSKLIVAIQQIAASNYNTKVGINKTKEFVKKCKELKWIIQNEQKEYMQGKQDDEV